MSLTPCKCPKPNPRMKCFRADDGNVITVIKEWDTDLRRWHVSIGAYPRKAGEQEALEAIEAVLPRAALQWVELPSMVNVFVRHFWEVKAVA